MRIGRLGVVLLLATACSDAPPAAGGAVGATLSGRIADGGPATVVHLRGSGLERDTRADSLGRFRFDSVPRGRWLVTPIEPGHHFEPMEYELTVGDTVVADLSFRRIQATEGLTPEQADRLDTIR